MYQDKGCPGVDSIHHCCLTRDLNIAHQACSELREQLNLRGNLPCIVAIKGGTAKVFVEGGEWSDTDRFRSEFSEADEVYVITRWEWHA